MSRFSTSLPKAIICAFATLWFAGCQPQNDSPIQQSVNLQNHSAIVPLVKALPDAGNISITTLISSGDTLPQSKDYIFGGMADGLGLIKNNDGTYTMLANHEDNFAVSRVTLDASFKPVRGEYIMTSDDGLWRLCSATMVTPEEHGFGPLFLTCGESGPESQTHIVDPRGPVRVSDRIATAFGYWSAENALPLPKGAYPGRTAVLIGDDDFTGGGQVALYLGNSVGDLDNGNLYVLARTDNEIRERRMTTGRSYSVEFRQITNQKSRTAPEFNQESARLNAIQFGRVEDLDYTKSGSNRGRVVYFCVTGQDFTSAANRDSSSTMYGRVYRLTLNDNDPLRGTLEVIFDGDDVNGPARMFMNPDNICVTENYVYIQEDPNRYRPGGFDTQRQTHDAYVYQWRIGSPANTLRPVLEADLKRGTALESRLIAGTTTYPLDAINPGKRAVGEWEYGALVDVSELIGVPNTFALCIQSHTWREDRFRNPDKGTLPAAQSPTNRGEGSQIVLIRGLPR